MLSPNNLKQFLTLGPGWTEAGRIIASRSDLIPAEHQAELLHRRYEPEILPARELKNLIKRFSHFAHEPLRTHVLGSTHQAVLHTGERVLVTINYPLEIKKFKQNLGRLRGLFVEIHSELDRRHRPAWQSAAEELEERARSLLDLTQAAGRMEIFNSHESVSDKFTAPRVLWQFTAPSVLTQRAYRVPQKQAGLAKSYLIRYFLEAFVYQYGVLGYFLLRPRLDDFSLLDKNRILANNFLATGWLEPRSRREFTLLLYALLVGDTGLAAKVLLKAHYDSAEHPERHRAGVVLPRLGLRLGFKTQHRIWTEQLWLALESAWQGHLTIPLSFSLAAESLLFLETMIADWQAEADFASGLLSAVKKHAPQIFGVGKSASLGFIAKTVIG